MEKKTIGILGGMGPMATADLFTKIVAHTKSDSDNGHIRIYMDNNPGIPDRTAAISGKGPDPVEAMSSALETLKKCGADCIVMPCNTAHYFLPRLRPQTEIPFISILEETAKECKRCFPGKKAVLLGTAGTVKTKIYEGPLTEQGVDFIVPDEQGLDILMEAIFAVKAGKSVGYLKDKVEGLFRELRARGGDYFILGCTELPMLVDELAVEGPFIDPTLELAKSAIRFAGYEVI